MQLPAGIAPGSYLLTFDTQDGAPDESWVTLTSSGADLEHNPDRGPSYCDLGEGLLDLLQMFARKKGALRHGGFDCFGDALGEAPVLLAIPPSRGAPAGV